jgi:membrane dipeptidase
MLKGGNLKNMKNFLYADMHCDTLTACLKSGENLLDFNGQINLQKLAFAHCGAQCFAIFTQGQGAQSQFFAALGFYFSSLQKYKNYLVPVQTFSDIQRAEKEGKIASILTVENLGFAGGDVGIVPKLKAYGVKMASLVWNVPNQFGYPNFFSEVGASNFLKRCGKGLTPSGKEMVENLQQNNIIVDVSHLSDGGVDDVLAAAKKPIIASHSNCCKVQPHSRNLSDAQIKKIADVGGVIGVNFCPKFVVNTSDKCGGNSHYIDNSTGCTSAVAENCCKAANGSNATLNTTTFGDSNGCADNSCMAEKSCCTDNSIGCIGVAVSGCDFFEGVKNHIKNLIDVGGEDVVAIGSDFDGMTPSPQLPSCESMQPLFDYLMSCGIPYRVVEKLARKNFFRLFKETVG